MESIQLEAIPNQKINVQLSRVSYNIRINTRCGLTFLSLLQGEEPITYSRICLPNRSVAIPKYKFNGVLFWVSQDDETPYYPKFGTLHKLYYATLEEFKELTNGA